MWRKPSVCNNKMVQLPTYDVAVLFVVDILYTGDHFRNWNAAQVYILSYCTVCLLKLTPSQKSRTVQYTVTERYYTYREGTAPNIRLLVKQPLFPAPCLKCPSVKCQLCPWRQFSATKAISFSASLWAVSADLAGQRVNIW